MLVSLIQRPTEIKLGRKTVLVDGSQVGYVHGNGKPLLFTRHVDEEEAAAIKAEVERIEGISVGKVAIPAPTPPEWLDDAGDADDFDD